MVRLAFALSIMFLTTGVMATGGMLICLLSPDTANRLEATTIYTVILLLSFGVGYVLLKATQAFQLLNF